MDAYAESEKHKVACDDTNKYKRAHNEQGLYDWHLRGLLLTGLSICVSLCMSIVHCGGAVYASILVAVAGSTNRQEP